MLLLAAMRYRNWKQRVIAGLQPVTLETTHNSCFDYSQIPTRQALLRPSPSNSFLLHCVILLQGIVFVVFVVRIRLPRTPASSSSLYPPCRYQKSMLFNRPPVRLSWTSAFRSIRKIPLPCARFFSVSVPRYTVEMGTVNTSERLSKLRQLMREHNVDVYSMTSYLLWFLPLRRILGY